MLTQHEYYLASALLRILDKRKQGERGTRIDRLIYELAALVLDYEIAAKEG